MNIAILGATSHIAGDLIESFAEHTGYACTLFVRNPAALSARIEKISNKPGYLLLDYEKFSAQEQYDVILNFVGVGDPARAGNMGASIFDVTLKYDQMALDYVQRNPDTRYIFLSSGAVFGGEFEQPVTALSNATVPINQLSSTDWYSLAKLYAEARHRALAELHIVDVRVFNYFSHSQDLNARFLITDLIRALAEKQIFSTTPENIVRDYITPIDFFHLIRCIIEFRACNLAVDCYSRDPVQKFTLLDEMKRRYGLGYEINRSTGNLNASRAKMNYYSLNRQAEVLGYRPEKTSLEGIFDEIMLMGVLN